MNEYLFTITIVSNNTSCIKFNNYIFNLWHWSKKKIQIGKIGQNRSHAKKLNMKNVKSKSVIMAGCITKAKAYNVDTHGYRRNNVTVDSRYIDMNIYDMI